MSGTANACRDAGTEMLYDPGRYETVFYPAMQTPDVRIVTLVIARRSIAPVIARSAATRRSRKAGYFASRSEIATPYGLAMTVVAAT